MSFTDPLFLFIFLPFAFLAYAFARNGQGRLIALVSVSSLFYFWGAPGFFPVAVASALLDYAVGKRLGAGTTHPLRSRLLLAGAICANLAMLVYYKYATFLIGVVAPGLVPSGQSSGLLGEIILPIGISFVVFEKITYLVDVYRGISRPAASFGQYLTYVLFFPKLLAGPIVKYHEIEEQLRSLPAIRREDFERGFLRFMQGLAKKILLADVLGGAADQVFALGNDEIGFASAWIGVGLFTLQIYFDFSAYSDMAIGLARMFGFSLRENFHMPYLSRSVSEFWTRWHISLSTWVRDYLYVPLGGNRGSAARTIVNLWICFLASGIWHGAAWTFVAWGAYNGVFLTLERLFLARWLSRVPAVVAWALTLVTTMVGWAIFRSTSAEQCVAVLKAMASPGLQGQFVYFGGDVKLAAAVAIGLCLAGAWPGARAMVESYVVKGRRHFGLEAATALLFLAAVVKLAADPFKPFLYFRF